MQPYFQHEIQSTRAYDQKIVNVIFFMFGLHFNGFRQEKFEKMMDFASFWMIIFTFSFFRDSPIFNIQISNLENHEKFKNHKLFQHS